MEINSRNYSSIKKFIWELLEPTISCTLSLSTPDLIYIPYKIVISYKNIHEDIFIYSLDYA
jgi:hypothetical protein